VSDSIKIIKNGPGFVPLLTILFIVLKLTQVIEWSWWWVLSPVWIAASVFFVVISFLFLLFKFYVFLLFKFYDRKLDQPN